MGERLGAQLQALSIEKMQGVGISGVSVGDKGEHLFGIGRSCGFAHRNGSRQGSARVRHVIGDNLPAMFGEEEKDKTMFATDFDISFIAGEMFIDASLVGEIEAMAPVSGGFGIIEHSLIGDGDAEKLPEHKGGFASTDSK